MFGVIFSYVLATNCGINAYCYRDDDDIMVELIGNQLRRDATAVDTVEVQNEDQCMDHCLYKGYCSSFNAIQKDHQVKCELFNITSNDKKLLRKHVNSSYYEVHLTCQNSSNVANKSGCGSNCSIKRDCVDWLQAGYSHSGVYEIDINGKLTKVYCDMKTKGGGWIKFFNRSKGSVYFNKSLAEYIAGFGDVTREFWLGLENLHQLTSTGNYITSFQKESFSTPFEAKGLTISAQYELKIDHCISGCSILAIYENKPFGVGICNTIGWLSNPCITGVNFNEMHSMMFKKV
ncbi:fibrinogen beta chain-like [Hydractinia symbiolongicarpus]|uniref:fibrinogen beta chain-like n=1 Tax=Hydractinia symbiolongicarpus TaxID=13093 RepID=UPI00254D91F1|nr:fibrinogen beta chain-like [Hydractinia symbiolongicarpus]